MEKQNFLVDGSDTSNRTRIAFDKNKLINIDQYHQLIRNALVTPSIAYIIRYYDNEGDLVTISTQNEWEEMNRSSKDNSQILIFSHSKIEFKSDKPISSIPTFNLQGKAFYTWVKPETSETWFPHGELTISNEGKVFLGSSQQPINTHPPQPSFQQGVAGSVYVIEWKREGINLSSGSCLFYYNNASNNENGVKLYWDTNYEAIVFTGWIEYAGQPRLFWRGSSDPNIVKPARETPLDLELIEEARLIGQYIDQIRQLWDEGERDIKKNLYLLHRFNGTLSLVKTNLNNNKQ